MTKNQYAVKKMSKCCLLFASLSLVILVMSSIGNAYEKEIVLGEAYETKQEKESLKDRFRLEVSLGYGYSYAQFLTGLYGPSDDLLDYLDRLNMDYSENYTTLRVTATYAISQRLGVYLAIPSGVVKINEGKTMGERLFNDKYRFGVGDIYGGMYFIVLQGSKSSPTLVVNVDANSDIAKYYSLGDGVWDFTYGLQIRQLLSDSFYIYGVGDYTQRLKKHNVDPGDIIGYGGGIGFLAGQGALEMGVKAANIRETKIDGVQLFDKDEDLAFVLSLKSLYKGAGISFTMGNLDEGISIKKNTFGLELSYAF
jgi:hypothetical protein